LKAANGLSETSRKREEYMKGERKARVLMREREREREKKRD